MTRSLSNLYKQRYILSNGASTRVINSNSRIEARMQELKEEMEQNSMQQQTQDGFVAGLQMEVVEAIPPEKEVSSEEILQKAQAESETILAEAKRQSEAILTETKEQAVTIQKQAQQNGYDTGYKIGLKEGNEKAEAELAVKQEQMEETQRLLEEDYRQKIEELEPYLVDIIANVFEQVFHVQFDDKKEILVYLIQKAILSAEGTKDFQIRVSLKDYEFIENHKNEIKERVGESINIDIMADAALIERQCIIETDSGVFDCGMDVQLDNLIKALRSLSL